MITRHPVRSGDRIGFGYSYDTATIQLPYIETGTTVLSQPGKTRERVFLRACGKCQKEEKALAEVRTNTSP